MDEITRKYLELNKTTINIQDHLNKEFIALIERMERVEEKAFPEAKKEILTLNQQILALESLGIIQILRELKLPQIKMATLLGLLIRRDMDTVKKSLNRLASSEDDRTKTAHNYEELSKKFEELGLKEFAKTMELQRQKVENKK